MVRLFTRAEALGAGLTYEAIRWRVRQGLYVRLSPGVYFKGGREPLIFERKLAQAMRLGKPVAGELAAALHGFDGFTFPIDGSYGNINKVNAHRALIEIAATVDDARWEQALEWCLRKRVTAISDIEAALKIQRRGNKRIRRVMKLRPDGVPPTESLLETLMVQLVRSDPHLPAPVRQLEVRNIYNEFIARVDLAWPEHGVFLELDGEHHKDQPVYDANRQTRVVAATGWLVGRFTWTEVTRHQKVTLRRISELIDVCETGPFDGVFR